MDEKVKVRGNVKCLILHTSNVVCSGGHKGETPEQAGT